MLVGSIGYILSLGRGLGVLCLWRCVLRGPKADRSRSMAVPPTCRGGRSTGGMVVLVSLLVFIASHAFGQGAVIWVFISEIFPNRVRARGQALGSFTHWFMAAAISWTFPCSRRPPAGTPSPSMRR